MTPSEKQIRGMEKIQMKDSECPTLASLCFGWENKVSTLSNVTFESYYLCCIMMVDIKE